MEEADAAFVFSQHFVEALEGPASCGDQSPGVPAA